jgi:hypothetical protein
MNTLQEATNKKIEEGKEDFLFYVEEFGVAKAKEMLDGKSCLIPVNEFIKNYEA